MNISTGASDDSDSQSETASVGGNQVGKLDKFYADLWFGPFVYRNVVIEPGREYAPIYIAHPLGTIQVSFKPEQIDYTELSAPKKMTFEFRTHLGARHLKYEFVEES